MRYNRETLEVQYKGQNIAQILNMTVEAAHQFFSAVPNIARKLQTLLDVGLTYIRLGQSATTLSGGEAQRVKLALELSKRDTGRTHHRPALCRHRPAAQSSAPAARRGQHHRHHRTQSGCDQNRRLANRHGARGRRRWWHGTGRRHA
jgi:hypothetical protein